MYWQKYGERFIDCAWLCILAPGYVSLTDVCCVHAWAGLPPQDSTKGAVSPSLSATLTSLRSLARAQPQLQLQVLVTGSLYLVGDMLRLLGRAPK